MSPPLDPPMAFVEVVTHDGLERRIAEIQDSINIGLDTKAQTAQALAAAQAALLQANASAGMVAWASGDHTTLPAAYGLYRIVGSSAPALAEAGQVWEQSASGLTRRGELETVSHSTLGAKNVREYGGKPDGTSDCRLALIAAMTAAKAGGTGGTGSVSVFVPDGVYGISDSIQIPAGVQLFMESRNAVIKALPSFPNDSRFMVTTNLTGERHYKGLIRSGTIDGSSRSVKGIGLGWYEHFKITETRVLNCTSGGIDTLVTGSAGGFEAVLDNVNIDLERGVLHVAGSVGLRVAGTDSLTHKTVVIGYEIDVQNVGGGNDFVQVHSWSFAVGANSNGPLKKAFDNQGNGALYLGCIADNPNDGANDVYGFYCGGYNTRYIGNKANLSGASGGLANTATAFYTPAGAGYHAMQGNLIGGSGANWKADFDGPAYTTNTHSGNIPAGVTTTRSYALQAFALSNTAAVFSSVTADAAAGTVRDVQWSTSGSRRWVARVLNLAETGGSAGSDWALYRADDSGAILDAPLYIDRATGVPKFDNGLTSKAATIADVAGTNRQLVFATGNRFSNSARWILRASSDPETGGNAGSNLTLAGRDDTSASLRTPITFIRSTGEVQLENDYGKPLSLNYSQRLWQDGTGRLRTKGTAPTTATDGNLLLQSGDAPSLSGASITGAAATNRDLSLQTAGSARWTIRAGNGAEAGSNAGSDFNLNRVSDAGSTLGTSISITRSTGQVNFADGNVGIGFFGAGSEKLQVSGNIKLTGVFKNAVYTKATLPSASASGNGAETFISDPAATKGPIVYSNGTAWLYAKDDSAV